MKKGARARLFVAVDLPEAPRVELARWCQAALHGRDGLRRIEPAALHVTLCFLGHRPVDEIADIADLVLACAMPLGPALLEVGAPVWLPPRRPRVLAVELGGDTGALEELQRDVSAALATAIGFAPEKRRFRPHVTVARMRAGAAPRERELAPTPALRFAPEALTLYRSRLQPSGAVYEAVARAALWAGPTGPACGARGDYSTSPASSSMSNPSCQPSPPTSRS